MQKRAFLGTRCMVQRLAQSEGYINPASHNAQRYRHRDERTDDRIMPIADHSCCAAVRSAKIRKTLNLLWPIALVFVAHIYTKQISAPVVYSIVVLGLGPWP